MKHIYKRTWNASYLTIIYKRFICEKIFLSPIMIPLVHSGILFRYKTNDHFNMWKQARTEITMSLVENVHHCSISRILILILSFHRMQKIELSKNAPFTPHKFSEVKRWNFINIWATIFSIFNRKINRNLMFNNFESN